MRSYGCYYYRLYGNALRGVYNTACWAGLSRPKISKDMYRTKKYDTIIKTKLRTIYIDNYGLLTKEKYKLLEIINTMTPCQEVEYKGSKYIRYKLILDSNYRANLVFLNFIRMVWYKPANLNYEDFFNSIMSWKGEEGLKFLLEQVNNNINYKQMYSWGAHSLIYKDIIPKTFKDLKNYFKKTHIVS